MIIRRDVFQAIADPTRREIIILIAKKTLTPNAVADSFDISRQAISKHIKILIECGLIAIHQQGRERYCYLQTDRFAEVEDWLKNFRKAWDRRFEKLDAMLQKIKQTKKNK